MKDAKQLASMLNRSLELADFKVLTLILGSLQNRPPERRSYGLFVQSALHRLLAANAYSQGHAPAETAVTP